MNDVAVVKPPETIEQDIYSGTQSLAVSLARAEVDQQVATARALPRIVSRVVLNIQTLATLDAESADECIYALPRGGKPIKGPSIRLAEIIGSQWGNARVGARVVHVDRIEKFVEAEGVFHDLETNMATTSRVRRRISDKKGALLSDDMIIVTGNAACAIAKRNAILGAVPKAVWRKAYAAVESVITGDIKTLTERRDAAMKAFAAFGVTPDQVLAALALNSAEDITLEHMPVLTGMRSALKSGESSVEEMFPRQTAPQQTQPLKARLQGAGQKGPQITDHIDRETGEITNTAAAPAEQAAASKPSPASAPLAGEGEGPGQDDAPTAEREWGTEESLRLAHAEGVQAKAEGRARKAMPSTYSAGDTGEDSAWANGYEGREF